MSKITQFDFTVCVAKNIVRFNIAINYVLAMDLGYAFDCVKEGVLSEVN